MVSNNYHTKLLLRTKEHYNIIFIYNIYLYNELINIIKNKACIRFWNDFIYTSINLRSYISLIKYNKMF